MKCRDCKHFKDEMCNGNLWEEHPMECLLKMVIQELRLEGLESEEGEDWKY